MKLLKTNLLKVISITCLLFIIFSSYTFAQNDDKELQIECILIGQTDIWDIGQACKISLNRVEKWVQDIEKSTGIPANITRIEGKNYNKTFIQNYLNNLTFERPENTIVIFYGTGHGFNYDENVLKYPVFAVHPTRKEFEKEEFEQFRLSLQKDIHDPLLRKGARFVTTLGELCNGLEKLPVPDIYRPMKPCANSYRDLFLETEGDIIAASSKRGQLSYTSGLKGGVFLGEFLRSFYASVDDCNEKPDWGSILDNTQVLTKDINGQEPIYDVGYIGSPAKILSTNDNPTKKKRIKNNKDRLKFPKKEKFDGNEIVAPKIIYIEN